MQQLRTGLGIWVPGGGWFEKNVSFPSSAGGLQLSAGMRFKKLGTLLSEWERTEAKPSVLRAETEEGNEGDSENSS